MRTEPIYYEGDYKYRTEPGNPTKIYRKTSTGEVEIPHSDKGFCEAIAYNGSEVTQEEYQKP